MIRWFLWICIYLLCLGFISYRVWYKDGLVIVLKSIPELWTEYHSGEKSSNERTSNRQ